MSKCELFRFEGVDVRVLFDEGIWTAGRDLGFALGHQSPSNLAQMAKPNEKRKAILDTEGGPQLMVVVSESGVDRILKRVYARSPEKVDRLIDWWKGTVIPARRSTSVAKGLVEKTAQPSADVAPSYSLSRGFEFEGVDLDVQWVDGQPIWPAPNFAHALGYRDAEHLTRLLADEDVGSKGGTLLVGITLRGQQVGGLTMAGVWEVLALSRRPEAKRLRRYMTSEVMPSVMTRGGYIHPEAIAAGVTIEELAAPTQEARTEPPVFQVPRTMLEAMKLATAEMEARQIAEAKAVELESVVVEMRPAALAGQTFVHTGRLLTVTEAAAELSNHPKINIGPNDLHAWLRAKKWSKYEYDERDHKRPAPTSESRRAKRLTTKSPPDCHGVCRPTLMFTPKGVADALLEMLRDAEAAQAPDRLEVAMAKAEQLAIAAPRSEPLTPDRMDEMIRESGVLIELARARPPAKK